MKFILFSDYQLFWDPVCLSALETVVFIFYYLSNLSEIGLFLSESFCVVVPGQYLSCTGSSHLRPAAEVRTIVDSHDQMTSAASLALPKAWPYLDCACEPGTGHGHAACPRA